MNLDEAERAGASASDEAFLATSQPTNAQSVAAMTVLVDTTDTKDQAAGRCYRHFDFRPRREHSAEFKRALVARSLEPGVSVATIAMDSGIKANLLFGWRRKHLNA